MRWEEKAKQRLAEKGMSVRRLEETVDAKKNVLYSSLKRGSVPAADLGIRIAAALDVTAEWLFDNSLGLADLPNHIRSIRENNLKIAAGLLRTGELQTEKRVEASESPKAE